MNKKLLTIILLPFVLAACAQTPLEPTAKEQPNRTVNDAAGGSEPAGQTTATSVPEPAAQAENTAPGLVWPLDRAAERITKKPFGIYITRTTSPVQPERFAGYHTGTDFEILPGEEDKDVAVNAVCTGPLRVKRFVSGYGGVAIQDCEIDGQAMTVLYGHLRLTSIDKNPGDNLEQGATFAVLGQGYSPETDNERKHLHLGVHRGEAIDYRGYVQNKNELSDWLDLANLIKD